MTAEFSIGTNIVFMSIASSIRLKKELADELHRRRLGKIPYWEGTLTGRSMSALGHKQTCAARKGMSALPPNSRHVQRTTPCPLWANSGHQLSFDHFFTVTQPDKGKAFAPKQVATSTAVQPSRYGSIAISRLSNKRRDECLFL